MTSNRFDAILFDAGGVLVLPDPTVMAPLLAFYGGDTSVASHRRAHYAAMRAKSDEQSTETDWDLYHRVYAESINVRSDDLEEAAIVSARTRGPDLWRWPIPETLDALRRLAVAGIPMGVVSNASGQVEGSLNRGVCQVGPGPYVEMRCIIDSHVVGVEKPNPAIFDHALPFFGDIERSRIAFVGDSVTMDITSSTAAGLHPILIDPFDDHPDADFERISCVGELADELCNPE